MKKFQKILLLLLLAGSIAMSGCGEEQSAKQEEPSTPPTSLQTQDFWWRSEYPALLKAVASAHNFSLSTAYRTGPDGRSKVKLLLVKEPNNGLMLRIDLPKQAIMSVDIRTGKKTPSKTRYIVTIRDHNLDGMPDDFNEEPSGEPLYEEEFTKDGFTKFRNSPEHQAVAIMWVGGIGFSVNHFLHGIDSAMPRR